MLTMGGLGIVLIILSGMAYVAPNLRSRLESTENERIAYFLKKRILALTLEAVLAVMLILTIFYFWGS